MFRSGRGGGLVTVRQRVGVGEASDCSDMGSWICRRSLGLADLFDVTAHYLGPAYLTVCDKK